MTENSATLLSETRRLRQELFWQILKRDRLLFIDGQMLEKKYLRLFAVKECAIYDVNTHLICRKLRCELTENNTSLKEIERAVATKESERHEVWLAHLQHRNTMLGEDKGRRLNKHWFERLDYYYGLCVRLLHPDLYPNANANQRRLMLHITQDYAKLNLPVLAIKPELLQLEVLPRFSLEDLDEAALSAEHDRLQSAIADNESMMKTVRRAHPYNLQGLLADSAACAARLRCLDDLLAYLREQLAELEQADVK